MIKILKDINEYIFFISKINKTDNYSVPMLSNEVQIKNNLLESVNKKDNITFICTIKHIRSFENG